MVSEPPTSFSRSGAKTATVTAEPLVTGKEQLAVRVQCSLDLAARSAESGDPVEAELLLARALHLAAAEDLRRPFLDAPEAVRALQSDDRLVVDGSGARLAHALPGGAA